MYNFLLKWTQLGCCVVTSSVIGYFKEFHSQRVKFDTIAKTGWRSGWVTTLCDPQIDDFWVSCV